MDRNLLAANTVQIASALRTQLAQMAAASQVLEQSGDGEKRFAYLAVINQSICRILRVVNGLELLQRLTDEDEIRLFPADLDLGPWLERFGRELDGVLAGAGISFSLRCPEHLVACVDSALLQQMLLELVAHAAEAGTAVTLTAVRQDDKVCFTVSDNGPGVPADGLAQLFSLECFEQRTGLAFARQIAELHGGGLMADSTPNRGLSVMAAVPLREGHSAGLLESPQPTWQSGGFSPILIAMSELLPAEAFLPEDLG